MHYIGLWYRIYSDLYNLAFNTQYGIYIYKITNETSILTTLQANPRSCAFPWEFGSWAERQEETSKEGESRTERCGEDPENRGVETRPGKNDRDMIETFDGDSKNQSGRTQDRAIVVGESW